MILLKSDRELEKMRISGQITAEVLNEVAKIVEPGIETIELDRFCDKLVRQKGAMPAFKGYRGFPGSICVSINEEVVHGIPKKRKLKNGDIVSIDFGVLYDGYYGDKALTLAVGSISHEKQQLLKVTEEALWKGIEQVIPGNRLGHISNAIEKHVLMHEFSIVRDYVGHGIGRSMHEEPQIPNFGDPDDGPVLKEGMVFAIEPMVNMGTHAVRTLNDGWTVITRDKKPSAHFENTVAITENGPEVLTCLKKS